MTSEELRKIILEKMYYSAKNLHYEKCSASIGKTKFPPNHMLMILSFLLDGNHLIVGDIGSGKSSLAKIISSFLTGIPYKIYQVCEMKCNAQAYEEKLIGRLDWAKLNQGIEEVIWYNSFAPEVMIVDEINRLPEESQSVLLQGIDTGVYTYMNKQIDHKSPSYLTANFLGNSIRSGFLDAFLDRICVTTEEHYAGAFYNFEKAIENRNALLEDEDITNESLEILNNCGFDNFKEYIDENKLLFPVIGKKEKKQITDEIKKVKAAYFDEILKENCNDPQIFISQFIDSINTSKKFSIKRRNDPIDDFDMNNLSSLVNNALSTRAHLDLLRYSSAFAWLMGYKEVSLQHILFILPYIIVHRLEFNENFSNKYMNDNREEFYDLYLAKMLSKQSFVIHQRDVSMTKNVINAIQQGRIQKTPNDNMPLFLKKLLDTNGG